MRHGTERSKNESKLGQIVGWAFVIFMAVVGIRAIDWSFTKGEIVEYPMLCKVKAELGVCTQPEIPLNKTIYKPNVEGQEVVYWNEESGDINRVTKCAVRDRENWSCKYNDDSAEFGFTKGKYWNYTNRDMSSKLGLEMDERTYYLSRLGWMDESCKMDKSPYALCMVIEMLLN